MFKLFFIKIKDIFLFIETFVTRNRISQNKLYTNFLIHSFAIVIATLYISILCLLVQINRGHHQAVLRQFTLFIEYSGRLLISVCSISWRACLIVNLFVSRCNCFVSSLGYSNVQTFVGVLMWAPKLVSLHFSEQYQNNVISSNITWLKTIKRT